MNGMDDATSDSSDSDPSFRGSTPGRAYNLRRDFTGAHGIIVWHYFSGAESLYNEDMFDRRFRSPRVFISQVVQALIGTEPFILKCNMTWGRLGVRPLVLIVTSLRMLVYGY